MVLTGLISQPMWVRLPPPPPRSVGYEPIVGVIIWSMAYKNIEDARAASKRNYQLNKEKYINKRKRLKNTLMDRVNRLREESPCKDCGVFYPYYVMDFDHLPEFEKEENVITLAMSGATKRLEAEIKKCEVVCSNCHRKRTHNRRG